VHVQLVLRSINTSRSAFVSVTYQEDFFDAYDMGGATIVQGSLPLKVLSLQ
jgi:Rad9